MNEFLDFDDDFDEVCCNLSEDALTAFSVVSTGVDISSKSGTKSSYDSDVVKANTLSRLSKLSSKDAKKTLTAPNSFLKTDKTVFSTSVLESKDCQDNVNGVIEKMSPCINNRFIPGYTPKARKRKFPGPAGLLLESQTNNLNPVENSSDNNLHSPKLPAFDYQSIVSSQFSVEHLALESWQKLQTDVSSHPHLLSMAGDYSIQQILKESSRKRLPKYMVVPVLCVLIKSINCKETNSESVFMDDTGEIFGKISEDVVRMYKNYMFEGTALILKDVTFLCNYLILKSSNIASIYLSDGTVNYVQDLECIFNDNETIKDKNCGLIMSLQQIETKNTSCLNAKYKMLPYKDQSLENSINVSNGQRTVSSCAKRDTNKGMKPVSKMPSYFENYTNNCSVVEENLNDDLMDDFDELLGNLDESSILGEM